MKNSKPNPAIVLTDFDAPGAPDYVVRQDDAIHTILGRSAWRGVDGSVITIPVSQGVYDDIKAIDTPVASFLVREMDAGRLAPEQAALHDDYEWSLTASKAKRSDLKIAA